ncbi:hypothetical protein GC163_04535 [bacterium]|nr:hypothetical protein [bacterium]
MTRWCGIAWVVVSLFAWPCPGSADELVSALQATCRISQRDHSGTAFLVQRPPRDDQPSAGIALVTAAHVFEQMREPHCQLVLREQLPSGLYERREVMVPIEAESKRLWLRHPQFDCAALPLTLPENVTMQVLPWEALLDDDGSGVDQLTVGREVFVPCFPAKSEANSVGWPILRRGTVATYPLRPVEQAPILYLDISGFGGDSGAAVAMTTPDGLRLAGLVSGMIRQTDRVASPFEERIMHTPLGLSIVVQSPWIRRTIEQLP